MYVLLRDTSHTRSATKISLVTKRNLFYPTTFQHNMPTKHAKPTAKTFFYTDKYKETVSYITFIHYSSEISQYFSETTKTAHFSLKSYLSTITTTDGWPSGRAFGPRRNITSSRSQTFLWEPEKSVSIEHWRRWISTFLLCFLSF